MSLMRIFDIASSGMSAQTVRLNTVASNIANADSVSSSDGETYRARMPVFSANTADTRRSIYPEKAEATGVEVLGIVESAKPLQVEYRPDHPMANEEGYIFKSNVNPMEEMANMISASRSYQVNAQVSDTVKNLMLRTLNMGQ